MPQSGVPAAYNKYHLTTGDIAWDAVGRRFICTPACFRNAIVPGNGEISEDGFLLESSDGLNWRFLDNDNSPRLLCGPPKSDDSVHTGYGRLLRDLDGTLVKFDGAYWWLYRGTRRDAGSRGYYYRPLYARAPYIGGPWSKIGRAFSPLSGTATGNFTIGSFISAANRKWVYYTETLDIGASDVTMLMASTGNNLGVGLNRKVVTFSQAGIIVGGPYVIRRPDNHLQYAVQNSEVLENEYCDGVPRSHSKNDIYR